MKLALSGIFRAQVFRDGECITDVKTGNSLTSRGAFEILCRLILVGPNDSTADSYGGPVNGRVSGIFGIILTVNSPRIRGILEEDFVALNRADRIQYYDRADPTSNPIPSLDDNRQYDSIELNFPTSIDWGSNSAPQELGNDYPPLSGGGSGLPSPFTNEATFTGESRPGKMELRGFEVVNITSTGVVITRKVEAVLASAILPEKIVINRNDFLRVSWTLKIDPTFP